LFFQRNSVRAHSLIPENVGYVDQELKFRSHTDQAVKKGTQFGLAIGNIARATWGAPFQYLRRLFTAITAP
jgi:hypothetical protein